MDSGKEEFKKLGICPQCKKGMIVHSNVGFQCNYFKSIDDKCSFIIYPSYFSKEITESIALQLIEKGETDVFKDLKKKDGTLFTASLVLQDGYIKPNFKNETLNIPCPLCGGKVEKLRIGYACENYNKEDGCKFYIPQMICQVELDQNIIETIMKEGRSPVISGFKTAKNKEFSARLIFDGDKLSFSNELCDCPKCKKGKVYIGNKAYNCTSYKDESIKCDFVVWKEIRGREINPQEVITLCNEGLTPLLTGFSTKEGVEVNYQLTFDENFNVITK